MKKLIVLWAVLVLGFLSGFSNGFEYMNFTELQFNAFHGVSTGNSPLMVGLTLIHGADKKGAVYVANSVVVFGFPKTLNAGLVAYIAMSAVCLDGTLPGYHLHRGYGFGANSWLINLEGGGWCNDSRTCVYRKKSRRGSSIYMEKEIPFTGILSNNPEQNPDFFNWNRVKVRYCDGASFLGEGEDKDAQLKFRGQRIWLAAMELLMSRGMNNADQALLSGCSAGGLATIFHCDRFRNLFPKSTKVKCLSDAGLFLDAVDVSGGHTLRNFFGGVASMQGVEKNLPSTCTGHLDTTSCFFPENLIANIKTPMFILNAAYDSWQIQDSLAPPSCDPLGTWHDCKMDHSHCSSSQIQVLQGFRNHMLSAIKEFSASKQNGLFINSCFAHCQTERQDTWFADDSPLVGDKGIALAVGDWYFDRAGSEVIDCPYPCDQTCHNLVFRKI